MKLSMRVCIAFFVVLMVVYIVAVILNGGIYG